MYQLIRHGFHGLKNKMTESPTNTIPTYSTSISPISCIFHEHIYTGGVKVYICVQIVNCVPLAILARQVVLPEQILPKTQPLKVNRGSEGEEASTTGWWTIFLSRATTCPRMLLLVGGSLVSPASSGHAHSPTMFWQTYMAETKELFSFQVAQDFSSDPQKIASWLSLYHN